MKIHNIVALALLLTTAACSPQKKYPLQSKQAASGDWTLPYGEWSFTFVTPRDLMADTSHVRIIDTDGYLYTFYMLDPTFQSPDSINNWASDIRGPSVNFNKVKKPPQYIVFCWDSYADQKTYETRAVFGPETWQRMKTPADHTRPSGQSRPASGDWTLPYWGMEAFTFCLPQGFCWPDINQRAG